MAGTEKIQNREQILGKMDQSEEDRKQECMEKYWLWLCCVPGLSQSALKALILYFGSPRGV